MYFVLLPVVLSTISSDVLLVIGIFGMVFVLGYKDGLSFIRSSYLDYIIDTLTNILTIQKAPATLENKHNTQLHL